MYGLGKESKRNRERRRIVGTADRTPCKLGKDSNINRERRKEDTAVRVPGPATNCRNVYDGKCS